MAVLPASSKARTTRLQSLEKAQERLRARRAALGNWQRVADEIEASLGTTVRVANGYYPATPALCRKFGLVVLASAPVCAECGKVHVTKTCPDRLRQRRPRVHWKARALAAEARVEELVSQIDHLTAVAD